MANGVTDDIGEAVEFPFAKQVGAVALDRFGREANSAPLALLDLPEAMPRTISVSRRDSLGSLLSPRESGCGSVPVAVGRLHSGRGCSGKTFSGARGSYNANGCR